MRVYIAARYGRRLEMLQVASDLEGLGHIVTSSWISGKHETRPGIDNNGTEEERRGWAVEDLSDLSAADTLIAFTEYPNSEGRGRGGRHVEYGYAMAVGCDLIVVGPRENVFHSLRKVRVYPDWPACLEALQ